MGKKQHQSDKLYLTNREWKESYGGHKNTEDTRAQRAAFKRLPFTHCALTFLPFKEPVCTQDGVIYDKKPILDYIKKHGVSPVSGKKITADELIDLHFSKDVDGDFQCPVTHRTFTPSSVVVAIRQSGNVYAYDTVDTLNLKRNYLKDLLDDTPFQRKDVITLQDPNNLSKFNMEEFYHVRTNAHLIEKIAEEKKQMQSPSYYLNSTTGEAKVAIKKLNEQYVDKKNEIEKEQIADRINGAHYSQGKVSAGFTSTTMEPCTTNRAAILEEDVIKYSRVKKNGYVRLNTNYGPLNLELYCKSAPKTCDNFLTHCKNGYYNGSKFHRLIKHFMIQGGDPTGTGKGGESIWGKPFEDESINSFKFDARGILAMANKGSNTNQSQFFITFRPAEHLNGKHTIFGKLAGGLKTLTDIEKIPTDDKDVPLEPVVIQDAEVFVDPIQEAAEELIKEREELAGKVEPKISVPQLKSGQSSAFPKPKSYGSGIGKYIKPDLKVALKRLNEQDGESSNEEPKSKLAHRPFTNFNDW